jgi:hypothetical protein
MPVQAQQLSTISEYDGSTDIDLYFEHVEGLSLQYGWNPADLAHAVKQRLRGEAAQFISSQRKLHKVYNTWLEIAADNTVDPPIPHQLGLRPALRAWFREAITNVAAADAIYNLKQRDGEAIQCFYNRVVDAIDKKNHLYTEAQKAEPGYLAHFQQEIFTFMGAGMKEYLRSRTLGAPVPPVDADALLRAARSVEAELLRGKKSAASVSAVSSGEGTSATSMPGLTEDDMDGPMAPLMRAVAELKLELQAYKRQAHRNVVCYNCGGRGHLAEQCPSEKLTQQQRQAQQQQQRRGRGGRRNYDNRRQGGGGGGRGRREGQQGLRRGGDQQRQGNQGQDRSGRRRGYYQVDIEEEDHTGHNRNRNQEEDEYYSEN